MKTEVTGKVARSTGALATGGTALLALSMSTDAQASVVSGSTFKQGNDTVDTAVINTGSSNPLYAFENLVQWTLTQSYFSSHNPDSGKLIVGSGDDFKMLASGYTIGAGGAFEDTKKWENLSGQSGYIGVEFKISGQTHYGWMEASVTGSTLNLTSWAYESEANTSIVTPIPEPASLAILAAGAGGLLAVRRLFSM